MSSCVFQVDDAYHKKYAHKRDICIALKIVGTLLLFHKLDNYPCLLSP